MSTSAPIRFEADFSCFIGNRSIVKGEEVIAQKTMNGTYATYRDGDDEPIAWLSPDDLNRLAGCIVTEERAQ